MQRTIEGDALCAGTTAEHLQNIFCCWTRVEVMIAAAVEGRAVADLAASLELGRTLVSTHLADLARAGLLRRRDEGKRHIYELTGSARVGLADGFLQLQSRADDGSEMMFRIPRDARVMRLLGRAVRMLEARTPVVATLSPT